MTLNIPIDGLRIATHPMDLTSAGIVKGIIAKIRRNFFPGALVRTRIHAYMVPMKVPIAPAPIPMTRVL